MQCVGYVLLQCLRFLVVCEYGEVVEAEDGEAEVGAEGRFQIISGGVFG